MRTGSSTLIDPSSSIPSTLGSIAGATLYDYARNIPYQFPYASSFPKTKNNMKYANKTQTYTSKKKKGAAVSKLVKQAVLKNATTYHSTISDTTAGTSMTHNTIYTLNITQAITQGTSNSNRQGDSIFMSSLALKGMVFSAVTANAYQFRILVGWSGVEYAAATLTSGLGANEIFLPSTGASFQTNGIINPKAFQAIYDNTIDINSQVAATIDICRIVERLRLNHKFNFRQGGSTFGDTRNLYLVAIACVNGGTTGVTAAGQAFVATDLVFKNL